MATTNSALISAGASRARSATAAPSSTGVCTMNAGYDQRLGEAVWLIEALRETQDPHRAEHGEHAGRECERGPAPAVEQLLVVDAE